MTAPMNHCLHKVFSLCLVVVAAIACGVPNSGDGADRSVPYAPETWPLSTLSAYEFFVGPMAELNPADGVVPYQVAAPLWADHAHKARFIVLPANETLEDDGEGGWAAPEGAVVIKNFYYTQDRRRPEETAAIVETRLLIKGVDGWKGHTYVWNEEQTEAVRRVAGKRLQLEFIDESGSAQSQEYIVPNTNQCKDCHEISDRNRLLGVVEKQLARRVIRDGSTIDQLDWLTQRGVLDPAMLSNPDHALVDPFGEAPLEKRARSYLEANCAHCHRPGGNGGSTGLVLRSSESSMTHLGVCKSPVAAGPGSGERSFDIVPGHPDESIMIYRMESTDPEVKMPEIPNRFPHDEGIELIRNWIENMEPLPCE